MERREQLPPRERLADVIGLRVTDPAGMTLGLVVGRIISGTTVDLLVGRRRLFHRSTYMRLQGAAITADGPALIYHPPAAPGRTRLQVLPTMHHEQS